MKNKMKYDHAKKGLKHISLKKLSLRVGAIFGLATLGSSAFAAGVGIVGWDSDSTLEGSTLTNSSIYTMEVQSLTHASLTGNDGNTYLIDNILINRTGSWATSPRLQGAGVYMNSSSGPHVVNANVTINTRGSNGDGIKSGGNSTIAIFNGKLVINVTGSSTDAINMTTVNASELTIGNGAEIYSKSGIGVRANLVRGSHGHKRSNIIVIGDDALISTNGVGGNDRDASGHGVYAGSRNKETEGQQNVGTAKVTIGGNSTINTTGNNAYAVYANKTGEIQLGSTTIATTGTAAHGIVAEDGMIESGTSSLGGLVWSGNGDHTHYKGGQVYLTGGADITVDANKGSFAIYSKGDESFVGSEDRHGNATSGIFNIKGDLIASDSGVINLNANSGSQLRSNLVASNGGVIDLKVKNNSSIIGATSTNSGTGTVNLSLAGAKWNVTAPSTITDLNLNNGASVVFGDLSQPAEGSNRVTLEIENLSGNGEFHIGTDLLRDGLFSIEVNDGDKITITGSSAGRHKLFVNDINNGGATPTGDEAIRLVESVDKGATFILGTQSVDVGPYSYVLVEEGDLMSTGATEGYWSLVPMKSPPPPVDPGPGPGPGQIKPPTLNQFAQNSVGILSTNYLINYVETQTLLQRMGELRDSNNNGDVWARVYSGKLNSFDDGRISDRDMDYTGIQIGVDRQLSVNAPGQVYIGGMLGYTEGETDYAQGSGDTDSYHVGLYGTYMMDNGVYIDGILKYQHMKNSVNALTGGGHYVHGDDNSSGVSLGVEAGKRFYIQQEDQGLYIEPQGQLTYSNQGSVTIKGSNGLKTTLDSYKSVIGRASVIVGYQVVSGENPVNVYLKTGYVREFDGETSFTFNDYIREDYDFGGGWWDNGIGVNLQIAKRHNLYADASYARGGSFDKKQINLGYRFEF